MQPSVIYTTSLHRAGLGMPIWKTAAGDRPLRFGDVCVVVDGQFHRLFNATLPAGSEHQTRHGVPHWFEHCTPGEFGWVPRTLPDRIFISAGVHVQVLRFSAYQWTLKISPCDRVPDSVVQGKYEITCSADRGAFLVLKEQVMLMEQHSSNALRTWIRRHYALLPAFARQCGMNPSGTIVVVTSCTSASQCAKGVFIRGGSSATITFNGFDAADEEAFEIMGPDGAAMACITRPGREAEFSESDQESENPSPEPQPSEESDCTVFARLLCVKMRGSPNESDEADAPVEKKYDPFGDICDYIFKHSRAQVAFVDDQAILDLCAPVFQFPISSTTNPNV
ncbi:hypothetical protein B0H21DRAFT_824488 [Amylocystis lapponica]|nr:hypothetical protein B0H21DRAFT_824488 [Amylocystis lapponica]